MRNWISGVLLGVISAGGVAAQEVPNPLGKALRNILEKRQSQQEQGVEEGETHRNRRTEDRRAPYSDEQAEQFERGDQRWKEGDYPGAIQSFQQILEKPEDSLFPIPEGKKIAWRSVRDVIEARLRELPPEAAESYRQLYGGIAERLLKSGDEGGGASSWSEAATRYFQTKSGQEAADRLATWHLDRGELAVAARWLRRLSETKSQVCESSAWKLKALWVAQQLGDQEWRDELVTALSALNPAELAIGGQKLLLEELKSGKSFERVGWKAEKPRQVTQGEPTLYQRWSGKLCDSEQVSTLVKRNYTSREERERSTTCAFHPLVIGERVITRGWRGLEVRNRNTGELLWRGADRHTPEETLLHLERAGRTSEDQFSQWGSMLVPAVQQLYGNEEETATEYLLASLTLFFDENAGIVSSDGNRLFATEEQPLIVEGMYGGPFGGDWGTQRDLYGRDPSSNQMVAYDLVTGRELWRIGGGGSDSLFTTKLAGWYFRGAPISHEQELYVIAEKKGEIRLLSLSPEDGSLQWSQLLGYSGTDVSREGVRQRMSARPIVAEGLILCPTLTGWVVAVDRLTRTIAWYSRSKPTDETGEEFQMLDLSGLSDSWGAMPILAAREVALMSSVDGRVLKCLRLNDGKEKWSLASNEPAYVAGFCEKGVVIVSRTSVSCVDLDRKSTKWRLTFEHDETASGRGLIANDDVLYVPKNSGSLLQIDCREGKVVRQEKVQLAAGDELGLGNLVLTGNELVAVNGVEIRAFETQLSIEVAKRVGGSSDSYESQQRILEGEELVQKGKYGEAWDLLRNVSREKIPDEQRRELDERERLVLLKGLSRGEDYAPWRELLEKQLPQGKKIDDWNLALAGIRWLELRGESASAWKLLLRLAADEGLESNFIVVGEQPLHEIRCDLAVGSRLRELWEKGSAVERKEWDEVLIAHEQEFIRGGVEGLIRRVKLLGFHPLAVSWKQSLLQQLVSLRRFHEVESLLLEDLAGSKLGTDENLLKKRADLFDQLTSLMKVAGVPEDADWLRMKHGASPSTPSDSSRESVARPSDWKGQPMVMSVEGGVGAEGHALEIPIGSEAAPSTRRWRFQIAALQQRLLARRNLDERIEWGVPLRHREPMMELRGRSWIDGHLAAVEFGGMLQGVSTLDRKLLWSTPFSSGIDQYDVDLIYTDEGPVIPIRAVELLNIRSLNTERQFLGEYYELKSGTVAKSSSRICLRERSGIVCLDSMTGIKLWSLKGVSNETSIAGGEGIVYLMHANPFSSDDSPVVEVRRMSDGSLLTDSETGKPLDLKKIFNRAVRIIGGDLILRDKGTSPRANWKSVPFSLREPLKDVLRTKKLLEETGLIDKGVGEQEEVQLSRYSPLTGETLWSTSLSARAIVGEVSSGNLVVLEEEGEKQERVWNVRMLSLQDGSMRGLGKMNPQPIRSLTQDGLRIRAHQAGEMLFIAVQEKDGEDYSQDLISKVDVDGPFGVFDLAKGELAWQSDIRPIHLVLEKLDRSPVLIFIRKAVPFGGDGQWKRDIRILDRYTGREMLNQQITTNDQLIQVEIDTRERGVRLICSHEVLRMRVKTEEK